MRRRFGRGQFPQRLAKLSRRCPGDIAALTLHGPCLAFLPLVSPLPVWYALCVNSAPWLDSLPLWLMLVLTVAIILLVVESGYRTGVARARKSVNEREASIDALVGSTLGLLAFMLAFTFGLATSRYDARKQFVLDEAVAIRTADLRAQLLPEPHRNNI